MMSWPWRRGMREQARQRDDAETALVTSMPLAVAVTTSDGTIVGCNGRFAELVGREAESLTGSRIFEMFDRDDEHPLRSAVRDVAGEKRHEFGGRVRVVRPDQHQIWCRLVASPLKSSVGRSGRVTLLFEDISTEMSEQAERDAAASALGMQSACAAALSAAKSADDLPHEVLQALCTGGNWAAAFYWHVDSCSGHLHNTEQWHSSEVVVPRLTSHCRKHPLARGQELPGAAWEHACAVWLADLDMVEESLRLMKAGDEGMHCALAFPIPSEGGTRAVIELFGASVRPDSAVELRAVEAIAQQLGWRLDRLLSERDVRASEEHHRNIMELAKDAVISIDLDGRIRSANRATEAIFGYTPSELVGRPLAMLLPEDMRTSHEMSLQRYAETGRRTMHWERQDFEGLHKSGRRLSLEVSLAELSSGTDRLLTGWIRDVTQARQEESALVYQALHDPLTDLPNRKLLQERLTRAVLVAHRQQKSLALLFMDLDRFKDVNDTYGHHFGDLLLEQVGRRLEHALRESDTVARLGGDEFALILPVTDDGGASLTAQRMIGVLKEPFSIEGKSFDVGASIGIAMYPAHGTDVATLMRRADVAMYAAKRSASGFALYDPERDERGSLRLVRTAELREGIDSNQLVLHYQPKINLRDGTTENVEALVRWQHPVRGMVPPDEFIPLAEESGLMVTLTDWVLNEALRQHCEWREIGLCLRVAVNFSAGMLQDKSLISLVTGLLEKWQVDPSLLEMEITESAFMEGPEQARETVRELHRMGVWVSIDDFGTGYSSLGYLKHLRVDEVKIDKSFVMEMDNNRDDEPIVRSVVDLGHNFGLRVVAEGVDNRRTVDMLRAMNCDMAQGYFISRPLPAEQLVAWIAEGKDHLALAS